MRVGAATDANVSAEDYGRWLTASSCALCGEEYDSVHVEGNWVSLYCPGCDFLHHILMDTDGDIYICMGCGNPTSIFDLTCCAVCGNYARSPEGVLRKESLDPMPHCRHCDSPYTHLAHTTLHGVYLYCDGCGFVSVNNAMDTLAIANRRE